MFENNPKGLKGNNPDEYESEALSTLSRFNESALQLCDDPETKMLISTNIVRQAFEFWFGEASSDITKLTENLLKTYCSSYPSHEQVTPIEVL